LAMFSRYEFTLEQWHLLKAKCDAEDILFLSTPQNVSDLKLLLDVGIPAIKIGSDDFTNIPLLKAYAKTKLPLIISCGMSTLAEVYQALEAVGGLDNYPVILLLCTSQYPTPPMDVNLLKLRTLANAFPHLVLGFSDHTQGVMASSLAVGLGAHFFEKHFTLDHNLPGPDHWFSENPDSLREWVSSIRLAHTMMGSHIVRPTAKELDMRVLARRSIVAIKNIESGETLTLENIGLRRPGNGLEPRLFENVLGKKALMPIITGALVREGDFR
jgi:N,N'-diacetyllegionaminate synthase